MASKDKRQNRFLQKKRHISRQINIWNNFINCDGRANTESHRFHKKNALNCGNPNCVLCMNPRKAFGYKTMQEIRFECQAIDNEKKNFIGKWEWEDLNNPKLEW